MDKKSIGGHVKEFTAYQQGTNDDAKDIHGNVQEVGDSKPTHQAKQTTTGNARGGNYPLTGSYPKHPQKIRG